MALTKDDILRGLRDLGVRDGTVVMAHSSLSAMGEVEGGADTVIAALAEAVGEDGTLCMPAMASEQPFRVESSPSTVGIVTDRFRSWPGVKRGLHPTHSACCLGPMADWLIHGHIDQPTALGPGSPWGRVAQLEHGYILLMGCDQDRNTLLHSAEEAVDAPYLKPLERDYIDEAGQRKTKHLERFPGPHRDFIGLDRLFREAGVMKTAKIGRATCRLMKAREVLQLAIRALQEDPAAVLCDNPNCRDCVKQRAAIARHRLAQEDFTLAAVVDDLALPLQRLEEAVVAITDQGIRTLEFGPRLSSELAAFDPENLEALREALTGMDVRVSAVTCPPDGPVPDVVSRMAQLCAVLGATKLVLPPLERRWSEAEATLLRLIAELQQQGVELLCENRPGTLVDSKASCELFLSRLPGLKLAFNPAHFAHVGENPFLRVYYKGRLKKHVVQLYITDGCRPGAEAFTLPGQGQAEVKELMSILRCRGFDGVFCLKLGGEGGKQAFIRQCKAFWHLLETM